MLPNNYQPCNLIGPYHFLWRKAQDTQLCSLDHFSPGGAHRLDTKLHVWDSKQDTWYILGLVSQRTIVTSTSLVKSGYQIWICLNFTQAPRPGSLHIGGAGSLGGQPAAPQPQPRPPPQDFVDASQPLPPPIPVTGKLVVQGKFDFKSVSGRTHTHTHTHFMKNLLPLKVN